MVLELPGAFGVASPLDLLRHNSATPAHTGRCTWAEPDYDLLLTMSIPGRNSTAAMLARAGFVAVLMLVNVSGFRLVLARGWHGHAADYRL